MATHLYQDLNPKSDYIDKSSKLSEEEYRNKLKISSTLYIGSYFLSKILTFPYFPGNLSIYTREESIYELFSQCGSVKDVKIGINKKQGTPIGFCFVEYCREIRIKSAFSHRFYTHDEAGHAVNCLNQTKLDNRVIRVDWDIGFSEGRQFGRGKHGFQWRDFYRQKEDPERPKIPNFPNKMIKKNEEYGKNVGFFAVFVRFFWDLLETL